MAPSDWTRRPLETAVEYVGLGFAVLPECPPDCVSCEPGSKGKVPYDPASGRHMAAWQGRRAPTGKELDAWLEADARRVAAGQAPLNLGCLCGPGCLGEDGLIGADADGDNGLQELAWHLGIAVERFRAELERCRRTGRFDLDLGTAAYATPSGGLRALWRAPAGARLRTVGGDQGHQGLRLMWSGSQMVLPPSVRLEGEYRWLPGHWPWERGIAAAPASVLVAMAADRPGMNVSLSEFPANLRPYPAVQGELGPDRLGRLVPAGTLPYDLALLRDGVPKGERSEAVRRLELQCLRAGWTAQEIIALLAGQPWVQGMRRNILHWLAADVARAQAWLAERDAARDGVDAAAREAVKRLFAPAHDDKATIAPHQDIHHFHPETLVPEDVEQPPVAASTGMHHGPRSGGDADEEERLAIAAEGTGALGEDAYARRAPLHGHREPHCWRCTAHLSTETHDTGCVPSGVEIAWRGGPWAMVGSSSARVKRWGWDGETTG